MRLRDLDEVEGLVRLSVVVVAEEGAVGAGEIYWMWRKLINLRGDGAEEVVVVEVVAW